MIIKKKSVIKKAYDYSKRRKQVLQNEPINFRPTDKQLIEIFNKVDFRTKSEIIREALDLWIEQRDHPNRLMNKLRKMYPTIWRYLNRRKPYYI